MGISGLWELVKSTGDAKLISDLVNENGYSYENRQKSIMRFGVDISIMIDECLAAANSANLYAHMHGGPLQIFFYKLCKLLLSPGIFVFVFDGPERPSVKRGKKIRLDKDPFWVEPCMELIKSMGFHVHQAPGEAEAELGRLNALGIIDAVISSDGDAFVFGAHQVLRRIPKSKGLYTVYNANSILDETSYGPGDLLLLALLSGGDYSSGIEDCGVSMVTALVKCGFGNRLKEHLSMLKGVKLERALANLTEDIKQEFRTNSKGFFSSRHPAIATRIAPDALNSTICLLYTEPITSWSPFHQPPDHALWTSQEPDVLDIIKLCTRHFNWNTKEKLAEHLQNTLLEGLFIQALSSPDITIKNNCREIETNTQVIDILSFKIKRRSKHSGPPWGRLHILATTTRNLIMTVGGHERDLTSPIAESFSFMVWVPLFYLPPAIFSLLPRPNDAIKWAKTNTSSAREHSQEKEGRDQTASTSVGCKRSHGRAFPLPEEGSSSSVKVNFVSEVVDLTLDDSDGLLGNSTEVIDLTE